MIFIINNHLIPQHGAWKGQTHSILVEDEYLILVIFSHPVSVHPVNHLRVGVAHLLRDEVRVSTGSQPPDTSLQRNRSSIQGSGLLQLSNQTERAALH